DVRAAAPLRAAVRLNGSDESAQAAKEPPDGVRSLPERQSHCGDSLRSFPHNQPDDRCSPAGDLAQPTAAHPANPLALIRIILIQAVRDDAHEGGRDAVDTESRFRRDG